MILAWRRGEGLLVDGVTVARICYCCSRRLDSITWAVDVINVLTLSYDFLLLVLQLLLPSTF